MNVKARLADDGTVGRVESSPQRARRDLVAEGERVVDEWRFDDWKWSEARDRVTVNGDLRAKVQPWQEFTLVLVKDKASGEWRVDLFTTKK